MFYSCKEWFLKYLYVYFSIKYWNFVYSDGNTSIIIKKNILEWQYTFADLYRIVSDIYHQSKNNAIIFKLREIFISLFNRSALDILWKPSWPYNERRRVVDNDDSRWGWDSFDIGSFYLVVNKEQKNCRPQLILIDLD